MRLSKGTVMRFAAGFQAPASESHWYHLFGTKGEVETRRGKGETGYSYLFPGPVVLERACRSPRTPQPWFHFQGQPPEEIAHGLADELSPEARAAGHGGSDYYPVADFIRHLRDGATPDIDVYQAVDTAAPCILAARSAEQDGARLEAPDFRPNAKRRKGEYPPSEA